MRGKVTKIMDVKPARGRGLATYARKFIRITFKLEDGTWAKTDVCPEYRNYRLWKPIIRAGVETVLVGLKFRNQSKKEINADSIVKMDSDQSFNIGQLQSKCKICTGSGMDSEGSHCTSCDGAGWLSGSVVAGEDGDVQASLFSESTNESLIKANNKGDYYEH